MAAPSTPTGPTGRPRRPVRLSTLALILFVLTGGALTLTLFLNEGTRDVLVANRPIGAYEQISRSDVTFYPMPTRDVPEGALDQPDLIVGHYSTSALPDRQPVLAANLGPRLAPNTLRGSVVALPVTPESALGGRLGRGDRCDVLGTASDGRPLVLPGALVLDITEGPQAGVVLHLDPVVASRLTASGPLRDAAVSRTVPYASP